MTANEQMRPDQPQGDGQCLAQRDRAGGRKRRGAASGRRAGGNGGAMAEALRRAALVDQVRADRSG